MQFFDRLWNEVLAYDEPAAEAAVQDARRRCNEAFTELFDRRLMDAVDRLRLSPTDTEAKVGAVALYHLVIEGTMGLTGQHFIHDYLERKGTFPTTATGFRNVMRDEHRHVAYGTWFLRRRCAEGDRYGQLVQSLLMETLPIAASVLIEGGVGGSCDGLDEFDFLDYQSEQLNHFALSALARRLKLIGGATEEIQRFAASGAWRAARVL
jgi:ribonucleoside-diphosphate reductase beta chain